LSEINCIAHFLHLPLTSSKIFQCKSLRWLKWSLEGASICRPLVRSHKFTKLVRKFSAKDFFPSVTLQTLFKSRNKNRNWIQSKL